MRRAPYGLSVLLATAVCAMGQGPYSVQVAETAAPAKAMTLHATGGVTIGPHSFYLGGRGTLAPMDGLLVFGDLGWVEVENWDGGPSVQAGAMFTVPSPLPAALAIRGALYKPLIDGDLSVTGATLGGEVSRDLETVIPGLSVYGYLGLDYTVKSGDRHVHDVLNAALAVGAVFRFADRMSLYAEISHVYDPFIGGGMRMDF